MYLYVLTTTLKIGCVFIEVCVDVDIWVAYKQYNPFMPILYELGFMVDAYIKSRF